MCYSEYYGKGGGIKEISKVSERKVEKEKKKKKREKKKGL